MKEIVDRLLDRGATLAEYYGGRKDGQVTSVSDVDLNNYFWSGIILGDKAVFIVNDYLQPKNEEEKSEEELRAEAMYNYLEKMLAGWHERRTRSEVKKR